MKKIVLFIYLIGFALQSLMAQTPPANVCTSPATYAFDQEVTWYFDLTGNSMVTAGENLYYWSWTPVELPNGAALLTYEGNMLWSLTFTPTMLYGVDLQTITTAGNSAFWCNLKNETGTIVTGTIPYAQKELLRLGNKCTCMGTPSENDNTFFVNFGNSPITNPDANNNNWTNVQTKGIVYELFDTKNVHRYDITASGSFLANNNSGFTTPDPNLLGQLANSNATISYLYLSAGTGNVTISCLNPNRMYRLSIFGSRNTTSVRQTKYTVSGASTDVKIIQTSGSGIATNPALDCNDDEFYVVEMFPNSTGIIDILVEIQSGGYAYINLMKIEEIINPSSISVTGIDINTSALSTSGPSLLSIDYTPANTTQTGVSWSVSDESIAVIDNLGNLKPKKAGTVTVTAQSGFNNNLTDQIDVTFSNLITSFYLTGMATEAGSDESTSGIAMRRVYDADSTVTNLFEIYTSFMPTETFRFFTTNDGNGIEFGGDNAGNLLQETDKPIATPSDGWKYITVDLNTRKYTVNSMYGWNIVSNMLPKEAGQESWWGGVESLPNYEGNGVWSGTVNFSEATAATNDPRFYVELAGTGREVKYIKNTENSLIFKDKANGITYIDIPHFNGEYLVKLDMQNFTFDISKNCQSVAENKITIMGSSVAKGYAADVSADDFSQYNGYAHQYDLLLQNRFANSLGGEWDVFNVSIGGNTTVDLLNRFDRNLLTSCGKYVVYGLSLANEGLMSKGQAAFDQFKSNMQTLIDLAKQNGIVPVVANNYPHGDYTDLQYHFIKEMNLLIHQWDVASINMLGAIDNGSGNWVDGLWADVAHPNTAGYTQMFHSIVPSLFDALAQNKPQPVRTDATYLEMGKNTSEGILTIKPEDAIASFTTSFELNTSGTGTLATFKMSEQNATLSLNANGNVVYTSPNGTFTSTSVINNSSWQSVSFTHYFAQGVSKLYVNGTQEGTLNEKISLETFTLSDKVTAPEAIKFRNLFFYRSAMNAQEMEALHNGEMLKSSLEIYAPLDGLALLGNNPLVNLAQSTNVIEQSSVSTSIHSPVFENSIKIFPTLFDNFLNIEFLQNIENQKIEIFSSIGTMVYKSKLHSKQTKIDTNSLAEGLYFVKIGNQIQKIVKK